MSRPRSGVVLQGAYPPAEFERMVERIDALGFDHLWLTDSSLHARNSYAYLTLAATRRPRGCCWARRSRTRSRDTRRSPPPPPRPWTRSPAAG